MNGVLLLDKPKGISSASCVYNLRKTLGIKKIGHCGTLDPLASGLLPICFGNATRFSSFITDQYKNYRLSAILGVITSTGDLEGEILQRKDPGRSHLSLDKILNSFLGMQSQIPSMYSAIKKNGQPMYRWVRKGIYFKRESRSIDIRSIEVLSLNKHTFELEVVCSKGTYIRSLVESIGRELGVGSTLKDLRRISIGKHSITHSVPLKTLNKGNILDYLSPADVYISDLPSVFISEEDAKKIRKGQSVDYNAHQDTTGLVKIYTKNNIFLGIGDLNELDILKSKRLLPS
tara:strand:- start:6678 stop:7544 length:867 start_codon:yes stop_codon:yes gene_type:complete